MPTQPPGDGTLTTTTWVAVGAAVLLAASAVFSPQFLKLQDQDKTATVTDCTRYGLSDDDPRAQARTIGGTFRTQPGSVDAGELGEMNLSFTSGGLTGQYHVIDGGVKTSEPVGLVIHLHGDGAREFHDPTGRTSCLAAVAASHNALLVLPRTPDTKDEPTWWENLNPQRDWLVALTRDRLFKDLPVDPDRVTWMGYSGGAEMLSYGILAGPRDVVTKGAVMVGGGGAPKALDSDPTPAELDQPLWWLVGNRDNGSTSEATFDALTAAREGSSFYADEGFDQAHLNVLEGRDHFNMPDARILDNLMEATGNSPR